MKVRTKNGVKYNGQYIKPGTVLEVEDEVAEHLLSAGAAESAEAAVASPPPMVHKAPSAPESDAVAELSQVEGVSKNVAKILIAQGITDIEGLQAKSEADLAAFKGISKKGAKRIAVDAARFTEGE